MAQDRLANYIPVAERVDHFYQRHPNGRIITAIVEHSEETGFVLMRAEVFREAGDAQPSATGHAFEVRGQGHVNQTSHIENCETGAVGRALANLGMEVKRQPGEVQKPAAVKREPPRLDKDITTAQDILGKTNADLNEALMRKFGGTSVWWDRGDEEKQWLFTFLTKKVNEKTAEAR